MYRSDLYEVHDLAPAAPSQRLPIHVEPGHDEALWPWLCRLAGALELSPLSAVRLCFGIDSWRDPDWWQRPGAARLAMISERTGLPLTQVRAMTFEGWGRAQHDETSERFGTGRLRPRRTRHGLPIRVCPQCLAEDPAPYVRRLWLVGWTAVCPRHRSVLSSTCPWCFAELRLPSLRTAKPVDVGRCYHCSASLAGMADRPAHADVLTWQNRLLDVKRHGAGVAGRLGYIEWGTLIATVDVLLGVVLIDVEEDINRRFFDRVADDLGLDALPRAWMNWGDNYGTFLILAWVFDGWPDRLTAVLTLLRAPSLCALLEAPRSAAGAASLIWLF